MLSNILNEMVLGNFSFLILVVGIVQACIMLGNRKGVITMEHEQNVKTIDGIRIMLDKEDNFDFWEIKYRKQFSIHENELIIFDEDGSFRAWYNLDNVVSIDVIDANNSLEEGD